VPNEIIEALKAIRTFRDVKPCTFVVALDEEVVKRAIQDDHTGLGLVDGPDEAEEFLNKFFKLRQHIPLLVSDEMREFAKSLVTDPAKRRLTAGIASLLVEQIVEILDALIHPRVKTPRHVIRLLNAFNGEYHLASAREAGTSSLLSKGAVTSNLGFMAVMTVLREDYPGFYGDVSKNHDLVLAMDLLLDGRPRGEVEVA
jgi:hypothetical protein